MLLSIEIETKKRIMRKLGLFVLISFVLVSVYSFTIDRSEFAFEDVNWLTWEQAMDLSKTKKKKIVVKIYTNWCGWCKKMDKTTFDKNFIASYLNDNFYAVQFDAEQKEPIEFQGKVYKYINPVNGKRGYHEFASFLTMGRMSYPTTAFFNENLDLIQPISGYQDAETFEMIATYFGDDFYKKVPWETYEKTYVPMNKAHFTSD